MSKTAVITGSTGGIGSEIALALAAQGWNLVLINRSAEKAEDQRKTIAREWPGIEVAAYPADLMDLEQIRRVAGEVLDARSRIDALYNVSGVLASSPVIGKHGHDAHYAVNVLAAYLMIRLLQPGLKRQPHEGPSMVVSMSSSAIKAVKTLEPAELTRPATFGLFGAYATSKLALTAMAAAMAEELEGDNILIRSVDPGATRTSMTSGGDGMPRMLGWLAPLLFSPPAKQASKVVYAADPTQFEGRTGILVANRRQRPLPSLARDASINATLMRKLVRDAKEGGSPAQAARVSENSPP